MQKPLGVQIIADLMVGKPTLIRNFLWTFLPVAALILAGTWILVRFEIDAQINNIQTGEKLSVKLASGRLENELLVPLHHLQSLRTEEPIRKVIEAPASADKTPLVNAFVSLLARNSFYDQVRWIDEHGMERVRVNNSNGAPFVVAESGLQDKHDRYYFIETMRKKPGEIYISPLDLNVENGRLDVPSKPTLRMASPVTDGNGQPRGILIINIAVRSMLDAFVASAGMAADHLMLVNLDGYWLRSPDAADEWGFMFKRKETFATRHPDAWARMDCEGLGQIELADGMWTCAVIYPAAGVDQRLMWKAISRFPESRLAALRQRSWSVTGAAALLILVLYGFGLWQLLLVIETKRKAEFQAKIAGQDRRLVEIVQGMNEACFALDAEWRFIFVNERTEILLQRPREQMLGNSIWDVFTQLAGTPIEQQYRRVMTERIPISFEILSPIVQRWLDVRLFPSGDGLAAFILDIDARKQAELAQRQSEERLETVIENMSEGLIFADLEGHFVHTNRAAVEMHGFAERQQARYDIAEFNKNFELCQLDGTPLAIHERPMLRVFRGEILRDCEVRIRRIKSDWERIFSYTGRLVREPSGKQIGFLTITDSTARKSAEANLRDSEARFSQAFHSSPVALVITRVSDGHMVDVNDNFIALTGYTREEILGHTSVELGMVSAETRAQSTTQLSERGAIRNSELTLKNKNGEARNLLASAVVVTLHGQPHFIGSFNDITDRKQAENEVRQLNAELEMRVKQRTVQLAAANIELDQNRAELQNIFESLPGLYLVLTPELKIVAASDAYLKATMTTRQGIFGRGLFEVFPDNPDDSEATGVSNLRASLERVRRNLAPDSMAIQKYDVRRPDGRFEERFWSPINSPVLGVDRQIKYIIHRVEDVTDFVRQKTQPPVPSAELQTRMEQMEAEIFQSAYRLREANSLLETANKELEAFSYSVSHDLRAPLRGISGFAHIVQEDYADRLDDEGRRLLDVICHEAQRMGTLIDDLLAFSRLGRQPLQTTTLDLSAMAQSVYDELMATAPAHAPRLELRPMPVAQGDRAMLRQVFFNLLGNAVKFTAPAKHPLIEVGSSIENGQVIYYVKDNGVGFNEKYIDKLFGVFQRLHSEAEFEGTGVGLALVQRILVRHGGRVWATSEVNHGATFYFVLPGSHPENHEAINA